MTQSNNPNLADTVIKASVEFMENNVGRVLTPKTDALLQAWAAHIAKEIQSYIDTLVSSVIGEDDVLYDKDGGMVEGENIARSFKNELRQSMRNKYKELR